MLNIYIDADSCPVRVEVIAVASRYNLTVYLVSHSWLTGTFSSNIHRILVKPGFDAADDWIAERIGAHDIAITADILLADRCMKKQAEVIGTTGHNFTADNIGMKLAMRELSSHLRELGESGGHNKSFTKQDRSRFLQSLEQVIQNIKRL